MSLAASVLVLLLAGLYAADALPTGAPDRACGTLMPESLHAAYGQNTTVLYEIDLTMFEDDSGTLQYTPGGAYTRTLPSIYSHGHADIFNNNWQNYSRSCTRTHNL